MAREQFLESKLLSLQRLIGDTEVASSQGWRALMDEDRLLTRFTISSNKEVLGFMQIFQGRDSGKPADDIWQSNDRGQTSGGDEAADVR